ncbi:MAG: helix-turn-helix transcriptional regulator [Candidatus Sulfotelmatobacter sp.]
MKNELRVLRARHDITQAELAEKLGVSRQTVNAIETERYDPSLPLAFKIAAVFGQPVEKIFFAENGSVGTRPLAK